jgi:hypothetical protein
MGSGRTRGPPVSDNAHADLALQAVPPAPTLVRAVASDASVRLTWLDGAGAGQVTAHVITGSDGHDRPSGPEPLAQVTGLVNAQSYSFTVAAVNSIGVGPSSAPSVPVMPQPPTAGNTWAMTTPMPTARDRAAAVRLRDGRVLVVAGSDPQATPSDLSVVELFDPATSTWTSAGAIGAVASGFGLTLLTDGRVLRTGGFTGAVAPLATAELFDPTTGSWTSTAAMVTARFGHSAVLLTDGRLLVAGGTTATPTGLGAVATAELYQPSTAQWTATGALATARTNHSATRLLDGRVLVAGGDAGAGGLTTAELYDPGTGTWTTTGSLSTVRQNDDVCCPGTAMLPGGDVLIAGGSGPQGLLDSAEIYRVGAGTWQPTGNLVFGRDAGFGLIPVLDGRILIVGGRDDWGPLPYAELYDDATGLWTRTNDAHYARMSPATALLADGRVLVTGGGRPGSTLAVTATAETVSPT